MNSYKELEVWQKAVELAVGAYKATEGFPSSEKYGLASQIRRAATSVPANIAEGWGRGSTKEYIQFLVIARGSLMELETHFIVAQRLSYVDKDQLGRIQNEIQTIGKMLNALITALRARA